MLFRSLVFTALGVLLGASAALPARAASGIDELRLAARKPPFKEGAAAPRSGLTKTQDKNDVADLRLEVARNDIAQRQIKKSARRMRADRKGLQCQREALCRGSSAFQSAWQ